ncbi:MAG: FHA domain-containing protein, partial [Elusimicrobiota bacterium]
MPKFQLKFEAAVLKEIVLDQPSLTVGRKPDNDIVIDNPAVSGRHCRIFLQGDVYFVEDLGSTNGTYVNGKRIQRAGLQANDAVGIAQHSLVFMAAPAGPRAAAESAPAWSDGADKPAPVSGPVGWLRVLKGAVGKTDHELVDISTYIGKSDRVQILIQGAGLFGSAPEVAACIHRRAEGYVLVAVVEGYPRLNGSPVSGSVALKEDDLIECGATTM